jgi:hypothetical protein
VDALRLDWPGPQQPLIRRCVSARSPLLQSAKVARDECMVRWAGSFRSTAFRARAIRHGPRRWNGWPTFLHRFGAPAAASRVFLAPADGLFPRRGRQLTQVPVPPGTSRFQGPPGQDSWYHKLGAVLFATSAFWWASF